MLYFGSNFQLSGVIGGLYVYSFRDECIGVDEYTAYQSYSKRNEGVLCADEQAVQWFRPGVLR